MALSDKKKREVKMGLLGGIASGLLLFFALFAITGNYLTLGFIPLAILMGAAQAYITPSKGE